MKCSEAQKRIYLYRELTAREREETDQHIMTCAPCGQIMERVNSMQNLEAYHKADIPRMNNEAQMTRRIMDAVEALERKETSTWDTLLQKISIPSLRYGMAAISFFLVLFFLGEYLNDGNQKVIKRYPGSPGKKIELNIASFHSAFLSAKEGGQQAPKFFSHCVTNCLQSQNRDCKECTNKFAKP